VGPCIVSPEELLKYGIPGFYQNKRENTMRTFGKFIRQRRKTLDLGQEDDERNRWRFILRFYRVWNMEQCSFAADRC